MKENREEKEDLRIWRRKEKTNTKGKQKSGPKESKTRIKKKKENYKKIKRRIKKNNSL